MHLEDETYSLYSCKNSLQWAVADMRDNVSRGVLNDGASSLYTEGRKVLRSGLVDMPNYESVYVYQLDVTQDFVGFFYATGNWKERWDSMREKLEGYLYCKLHSTGNSFESCFQFVEKSADRKYKRRIKVYNKFLSLLQSSGVMKSMGMNTKEIYQPSFRKFQQLEETKNHGWTRIEVSYYAHSIDEEKEFWK